MSDLCSVTSCLENFEKFKNVHGLGKWRNLPKVRQLTGEKHVTENGLNVKFILRWCFMSSAMVVCVTVCIFWFIALHSNRSKLAICRVYGKCFLWISQCWRDVRLLHFAYHKPGFGAAVYQIYPVRSANQGSRESYLHFFVFFSKHWKILENCIWSWKFWNSMT